MVDSEVVSASTADPLDGFALELQALREDSGLSYAEIAQRVTELREARGMTVAAARTPRSTVYACFRTGRARINAELLRDIVLALTDDAGEAAERVARYRQLRRRAEQERRWPETRGLAGAGVTAAAPAAPALAERLDDRAGAQDATGLPATPSVSAADEDLAPERSHPVAELARLAADLRPGVARGERPTWLTLLLAAGLCVLVNRAGLALNTTLGLGLFLDMIGTCLAAIALGPWVGAAVAAISQAVAVATIPGGGEIVFGLVGVTGALVWGYGVRRWRMGDDFVRYTVLGLLVAAACTLVGVPINVMLAQLSSGTSMTASAESLAASGVPMAAALVSLNITTSILDKLLASFIALALFVLLHRRMALPAGAMALVRQLGAPRLQGSTGLSSTAHARLCSTTFTRAA